MTVSSSASRPADWEERTSGTARYVTDLDLPGMLVGGILRSPHRHAGIRSVDLSAARRAPGVVAAIAGEDLPARTYRGLGPSLSDRYPIARGVVRYAGEEVAAVAAETAADLQQALRLIDVRYKRLPDVQTVSAALDPQAVRLHASSVEGNIARFDQYAFGEPSDGEPGPVSVRARYFTGRQGHACMETHCVVAWWRHRPGRPDELELWTPTQAPANARAELAHVFGLDEQQIRVHHTAVGGDFGSRVKPGDLEAIAVALSRAAGRPVRLSLERDEEFALTKHRYPFDVEVEVSAEPDGSLVALRAAATSDIGAYSHVGAADLVYMPIVLGSAYRLRSYEATCRAVYTNKRPPGAFRGAGGPAATFARECAIDELADRLGLDPCELRLRNAFQDGDVAVTGWRFGTARLAECLEIARERIGWDSLRPQGGSGRGVGLAAAVHVTGWDNMRAGAAVDLFSDGRIRVRSGCSDPGTGQRTVLAAIAAGEFGVAPEDIEVLTADSALTPFDPGAGASRGTFLSGNAVGDAAAQLAEKLRRAAAGRFGVAADDVDLSDGRARAAGREAKLGELVATMGGGAADVVTEEAEVSFAPAASQERAGYGNRAPAYSFAAQAVEVEVDRETGRVHVRRVVAAHDSGRIINRMGARGQVIGGVMMAVGAALGEELVITEGRIANAGFADYALPRAPDAPPVDVTFVEATDPSGRYGTKGVAEIALAPTAAAVANAVAHAVGVRVRDLPITPDKVLNGLRPARSYPLRRRPRRWEPEAVRRLYPRGVLATLDRVGTRFARHRPTEPLTGIGRPPSAASAVAELRAHDRSRALAGGTDLIALRRQGLDASRYLVDVTACADLDGIEAGADGVLRIGAAVTLAELLRSPALDRLPVIRDTIATIASPQVREVATVGGNLCQEKRCWYFRHGFMCYKRGGPTCPCYAIAGDHRHFHAALDGGRCQAVTPSDLATTLGALDAVVVVHGPDGVRRAPIGAFYGGPGEPRLAAGELVTGVEVPHSAQSRTAAFEKLSLWSGGFAVVAACASVAADSTGRVLASRVVVGGIAPTPYRARDAEDSLQGRPLDAGVVERASRAWLRHGHPLADNEWKLGAAAGLVRRTLERCRPC